MKKIRLLTFAAFLFYTAYPSQADIDIPTKPSIIGTISYVDKDGFMHMNDIKIKSPAILEKSSYRLKEWALDISPDALALLTVNREVSCDLLYKKEDHIVTDCIIGFNDWNARDSVKLRNSIRMLAERFGLGKQVCSEADIQAHSQNKELFPPFNCQR